MKSLRDSVISLEPTYTKSVIKAGLRTEKGRSRVWVVVEDDDDKVVYSRFMRTDDNVSIMPSLAEDGSKGCKNVESIVSEIKAEEGCRLIFGIRDKDYIEFGTVPYPLPEDVFVTDCRDIEMMMFAADSVRKALREWNDEIDRVLSEYGEVIRWFGYMRVCNYRYNLGCSFKKKVRIRTTVDLDSRILYPDWKESSISVFLGNCNLSFTLSEFHRTISELNLDNESCYNICQGHDVLKLLQYIIGHTDKYDEKSIRRKMVDSYSQDDFSESELYRSIASWSAERDISVLV